MNPEYVEEMKKLGVPWKYIPVGSYTDDTEAFIIKAANEYHALKSAVEELWDALRESNAMWHELTGSKLPIVEAALNKTEGIV
jgi:hypothetical protein